MVPGGSCSLEPKRPLRRFPGRGKVCSLRTAVRPGPEGVPTSDVPRAPPGASGAQSGGGPSSDRALAEDRLDCAGSTEAFVCSLPLSRGRLLQPAGGLGLLRFPAIPTPPSRLLPRAAGKGLHSGARLHPDVCSWRSTHPGKQLARPQTEGDGCARQ